MAPPPSPDSPSPSDAATVRPRSRAYRWLAVVPSLCLLGGIPFVNGVGGTWLGLPPLLAWSTGWVVVTSATMALIWFLDRRGDR
jgi:hypothetical protein